MSKRTRLLGRLKHVYSHNTKLVLDVSNDDIGLIIEGVEKQIAKKPLVKWNLYKCCTCNGVVYEQEYNYKYSYCSNCGQKQDWSEVDGKI